jgi:transcription termination/antitermination protein NusG
MPKNYRPENDDEDIDYDPDPIYLDEDEDEPGTKSRGAKASGGSKRATASDDEFQFSLTGGKDAAPTGRRFVGGTDQDGKIVEIPIDDEKKWYVIHCYSGQENKVRRSIEQRAETMGMQDKIFDVVVPTEEEIEVHEGKRKTVERRIFPGYILVQMKMDEDSWYVVRNTPGVTGFVGMGNEPTPLRPDEVNQIMGRMEAIAPKVKVAFKIGDKVRIIDGPFNDFRGTVSEIDTERTKVRVMVSFFGRDTPVELDFLQVEKS